MEVALAPMHTCENVPIALKEKLQVYCPGSSICKYYIVGEK